MDNSTACDDNLREDMDSCINNLLLSRQYDAVGVINLPENTYTIKSLNIELPEKAAQSQTKNVPYEAFCEETARTLLVPEDKDMFLDNVRLSHIKNMLAKNDTYFFTASGINKYGEKRLKKYTYFYYDDKKDIIISASEDITNVLECDALTGECNRNGFTRRVRHILQASTDKEEFAILFFNVESFKAINEMFGFHGGDNVLRYIAGYIRKSALRPLVVARFEADHFVCLVSRENVDYNVLTKLCYSTYNHNHKTINISKKCGVYFIKDKNMGIDAMCDRAKLANEYVSKDSNKPYAIYDMAMKEAYMAKKVLLDDLKQALANNEFVVYYQPIYETKTGRLASAEALVRWVHPINGLVSPAVFIPFLEANGHISIVDLFVEKSTREFLEKRVKQGLPVVPVDINMSWLDFYDEQIISSVMNDLETTCLPASCVRVEITESSYATVAENNVKILRAMNNVGIKILVDDFGSGYSSFSTIRDYEFDIIKLDMGFVQKIGTSPKTDTIIKSIIDMAHSMGIQVIAEGAETEEQVKFLEKLHCDYIQGYYFSKPLPKEEFEKLLDTLL